MKITKQEIASRVLQNGKPLDITKFTWDENTNTFSTTENDLECDFSDFEGLNIIAGSNCTFNTGSRCTFTTWGGCTFKTWDECVCIRTDIFEFFQIPYKTKIQLNGLGVAGFTLIKE